MKKIVMILCYILISTSCLFTSGCSSEDLLNTYPIADLHADWPYYKNISEIMDASSNVYSGKIIDISFEIIDITTGKKVDTYNTENQMLYTVYTVEVKDSFKGDNPPVIKIGIIGGRRGYQEEKQYELMNTSGLLLKYGGIPVISDEITLLSLNSSYLFCTHRSPGDIDYVINLTQFAYPEVSDEANTIAAQLQKASE